MTSVKCRTCGLVNFSTEPNCKRCKAPLFGPAGSAVQPQSFLNPPPPPVFSGEANFRAEVAPDNQVPPCIKCGDREKISVRNFVKVYNSPVAILGVFLGLLPYIILKLLLQTKHNLTGPFCEPCWKRFQSAKIYGVINVLFFLALLIAGIAFSIYLDSVNSEWWLLGSIMLALVLLFVGNQYLTTFGPKYKRVNSKEVVIDAPYVGEILYTK